MNKNHQKTEEKWIESVHQKDRLIENAIVLSSEHCTIYTINIRNNVTDIYIYKIHLQQLQYSIFFFLLNIIITFL